jgi:hypothetical protein
MIVTVNEEITEWWYVCIRFIYIVKNTFS